MVTPPPAAVTIRVETLAAADEAAEIVNVLLPLPGAAMAVGAKLAVTPVGSPVIENAIAALNPLPPLVVKVICTDLPGATLALEVLGDNVKVAKTVKLTVWVLVTPPPVADTVREETPGAAVEPAERVSMLLPFPGAAIVVGKKLAVTPLGSPVTDNAMAELNPFIPEVVKPIGIDPPGIKMTLVPLSISEKLEGKTVRLMS